MAALRNACQKKVFKYCRMIGGELQRDHRRESYVNVSLKGVTALSAAVKLASACFVFVLFLSARLLQNPLRHAAQLVLFRLSWRHWEKISKSMTWFVWNQQKDTSAAALFQIVWFTCFRKCNYFISPYLSHLKWWHVKLYSAGLGLCLYTQALKWCIHTYKCYSERRKAAVYRPGFKRLSESYNGGQ